MENKIQSGYPFLGKALIILLAVFIGVFYIFNELLDLVLMPSIIYVITGVIFVALIILRERFEVSNYLLLPVIILDGFFHLISPLQNLVENSPDWVIAFNLYGGNGMPVFVHKLMGVFLLATSGVFIYYLVKKRKDWYYYVYKYAIGIITMLIISTSYVIKMFA